MLVPLSFVRLVVSLFLTNPLGYNFPIVLAVGTSDTMCEPGATRSGFWNAWYHVGPRELYHAIVSSDRVTVPAVSRAPTVMASGALPGDVMPPYPISCVVGSPPKLPADTTTTMP